MIYEIHKVEDHRVKCWVISLQNKGCANFACCKNIATVKCNVGTLAESFLVLNFELLNLHAKYPLFDMDVL